MHLIWQPYLTARQLMTTTKTIEKNMALNLCGNKTEEHVAKSILTTEAQIKTI